MQRQVSYNMQHALATMTAWQTMSMWRGIQHTTVWLFVDRSEVMQCDVLVVLASINTHKPRRMRRRTGVYPDAILQVSATKSIFLRSTDLDECKRQCFVGKCRAFDHFPTGDCLLDNSVGDFVAPTAAPSSTASTAASCDLCEGSYKRCIGSWGPTNSYAPWLALATESSKSSLCNCLQETVVCLRRIIECASQVSKELGFGLDWLHPPLG